MDLRRCALTLLVIGGFIHACSAQSITGVMIPNAVAGVIHPLKYYTNFKARTAGTDQGTGLAFDACFQKCSNTDNCKAFDYNPTTQKCEATVVVYPCTGITTIAATGTTHYVLTAACDEMKVVKLGNNMMITGGTATTYAGKAESADACSTSCSLTTNCAAADFIVAGFRCRHFMTTNGNLPSKACYATQTSAAHTAYSKPCISGDATVWSTPTNGEVAGLTTSDSKANDYFQCQSQCAALPICLGYKYITDTEITFTPSLATRCQLYNSPANTAAAICGNIAVGNTLTHKNTYLTIRNICRATTTDKFTMTTNARKRGGILKSAWTTLVTCESGCLADVNCVGFDWNKETATAAAARCWFHTEMTGGCETPRASTCCDNYQSKDRQCNVANGYIIAQGVNKLTSGALMSANTLATCRALCDASTTCEGFDFNTANQCFLYTKTNICLPFKASFGGMNYHKTRFRCTFKYFNKKKLGGTLATGVTSINECEKTCLLDSTCRGFDYNAVSIMPCYLHKDNTICGTLITASEVNHYRLITKVCPSDPAVGVWTNVKQNYHTVGNTLVPSQTASSAIECAILCKSIPGCAGIDYDKNTNKCYKVDRLKACGPGVPDNCCDRIVLPTGCTTPPITGYMALGNKHKLFGVKSTTATTAQACAMQCNADTGCGGFDFDLKGECWMHSPSQECRTDNVMFDNSCCNHYTKNTICTNFSPPTFTNYQVTIGKHVNGGVEVTGKVTEFLCIAECDSRQTTCQSVDFNTKTNKCFIHTKSNGCRPLKSNVKTNHYAKKVIPC